jgi:hypothetical protein
MDGSRFDALTRAAASTPSRRKLLGAALGGLAAAVLGDRAEAAVKRGPGEICRKPGDCASGLCNAPDRTGRQYCGCTDPSQCPQPKDACHIATCTGTCGIAVNVGASCDDRNACTAGDTCQADGSCGGGIATVCTALDQCHTAGICDPKTGVCSNPVAVGTPCTDGNACTSGETCQVDGSCSGGTATVCTALDPCHVAGTCDPATGVCANPVAADHTACTLAGGGAGICRSGTCVADPCAATCITSEQPQCFWMENRTGNFCFVPFPIGDQATCEAASAFCNQGGGCYKWSTSSC